MTGKYTNNLQAALLYEGPCRISPAAALQDFAEAVARHGMPFNLVQQGPDFGFLMGPGELQVTATLHQRPAEHAVFASTLRSAMTRIVAPDAADRVAHHASHILIEIHHGVLGGVTDHPQLSGLLDQIGMRKPGHSFEEFTSRISALGALCRYLITLQPASLIHWTQSDMLFPGDRLDDLLGQGFPGPGPLTVHPSLYGEDPLPGYKEIPAGLYTVGAADFVGRELHVTAAPVPWFELYEGALAFIRVAVTPNGYIIPDGDTFGLEGGGFSYRVRHLDGKAQPTASGSPLYELTLLFHEKHGYTSPEFRPREPVGGMAEASRLLDPADPRSHETAEDWKKSEQMAKGIGGRFEVYRLLDQDGDPEPPRRQFGGPAGRPIGPFGRRVTTFGRRH